MTKIAPDAIESNARRGRPRNDNIRQLIMNTALDLAFEVGFRALTMEAIAAKTGVGKTTIYRAQDKLVDAILPAGILPKTNLIQ